MRFPNPFLILILLLASLQASVAQTTISSVNDGANIGLPENGVFTGSDFDTIQTNNGYIHIRIPLLNLKGRGSSFPVEFVYDSSSFYETVKAVSNGHGGYNNYYTWHLSTGVTQNGNPPWKLVTPTNYVVWTHQNNSANLCGTTTTITVYTGTIMIEPDGTTHHFVPDNGGAGNCFSPIPNGLLYADDGSGWILRVDPNSGGTFYNGHNWDLVRKDGTEITNDGQHTTLTDRNGNQIGYDSTLGTTTDTLGRSIPISCDPTGLNCEIDYTDSNGQAQRILYTKINAGYTVPASGCSGLFCTPATGSWTLLSRITLPNGLQYNFSYTTGPAGFPTLSGATLPTGASIAWTYSAQTPYSQVVSSRTVTANGQNANWKYTYGTITGGGPNVAVTDPTLNDTRYTCQEMYSSQTTNDWNASEVCQTTKVEYFSGSVTSGTLLKTVTTDYDTSVAVVPIRETTTWVQTNQVSKVETDWDSFNTGQILVGWKNPIHRREYAFGSGAPGPLVRSTTYNYEHLLSSAYRLANLAQFPTSQVLYEANGTTIHAQTATTYDSTTISATSGVVKHDYTNFSSTKTMRANPTLVQKWVNTTNSWLNTTNYYDDLGNLLQTQDPRSNNTYFDYTDSWTDSTCAPTSGTARAFVTTTTNALSQTTHAKYASCTSLPTSSTDVNSLVTTMKYDLMNRLIQKIAPDGGQVNIAYGASLPLTTATTTDINGSGQKLITTKVLDDLGQAKQTQLNSDPQGVVYTDTTYDSLGRVSTASNPYRTGTDITTTTGTTTYGYDALSRTTSVTYQDTQSVLTTTYCGSTTLVTDPTGRWRRSTTDALGRLIEVDEPNSPTATVNANGCPGTGEPIWVTAYSYDVADNLTQVIQNGSHQRNFTYDSLSHLLTSANPETGTITYTYDADGNVQTKNDGRNITTTYSYDPLNRELTRTYSNLDPTITTTYDQSNCLGLTACQNIGHRTSVTDAAGSELWAFQVDSANFRNFHREQRTTSTITKTTTYLFDFIGNNYQITYPTSRVVNYTFDNANRPSSAADSSNGITYATGFQTSPGTTCIANVTCYTPQGSVYAVSLGQTSGFTGLNVSNTYNSRLQPNEFKDSSTGGSAIDITYSYADPLHTNKNAGHVFSVTNNINSARTQSFTYDQVNRITSTGTFATTGSYCWGYQYTYDGAWGNLTSQAGWTPNYSGCTQTVMAAVTADGNNHISAFSYDAAGNATRETGFTYVWDAESQLKSAGGVNYAYDGDGRRVAKVGSKLYWYGSGSEILAETDASGNTQNEFVFFGGKRVALLPAGSSAQYYVEDSLGSSRVITSNAGAVCYDADFYPYGGERAVTSTCTQNNYKFEGKERDAETSTLPGNANGNDEFGARYYSNRFGRWLSADWSSVPVAVPYANLSNPQTLNLYSMVSDDPESFADLDGHCPFCIGAAIGATAGFLGDLAYQKITRPGQPINYKEAGAAALAGAITGGTAGLVSAPATLLTLTGETTLATGSSTVLGVTGASAGGVVGGVTERSINSGSLSQAVSNPGEIVTDAVTSGATEGAGRGAEKLAEKTFGGAVATLEKQVAGAQTPGRTAKLSTRLEKAQTKLEQKSVKASATAQAAAETARRTATPDHKVEQQLAKP